MSVGTSDGKGQRARKEQQRLRQGRGGDKATGAMREIEEAARESKGSKPQGDIKGE